ncbi:MAG: hypothetical protein M0Z54_07205 [Thermaerobacter sp.]|nr:hypothetical protein [Thermaerobacter sp.]
MAGLAGPDGLPALIATLRALTEDKIEATLARDTIRLEQVLVSEAAPLLSLRRLAPSAHMLPDAVRGQLAQDVARWQERTEYLRHLLETQLGYVDFARFVLGIREVASRIDESV